MQLKSEPGCKKVTLCRSIVKSQPHKQKTPRLAHTGLMWRFVKVGGFLTRLQNQGLTGRFRGKFCKENKKLDSNFVSNFQSFYAFLGKRQIIPRESCRHRSRYMALVLSKRFSRYVMYSFASGDSFLSSGRSMTPPPAPFF